MGLKRYFAFGSSNELSLCKYSPQTVDKNGRHLTVQSRSYRVVGVCTSLNNIQCIEWCRDRRQGDGLVVAAAMSNGNTSLCKFSGASQARDDAVEVFDPGHIEPVARSIPALGSVVKTFSPKHARVCTSLRWNNTKIHQVAVGYDKLRNDHGVLVWDIRQRGHSNRSQQFQGSIRGRTEEVVSNPVMSVSHGDPVSSLAWQPRKSAVLAVGTGVKVLKIFDLRDGGSRSAATASVSAHRGAIISVDFDPERPSCICTVGKKDTVVKIWDMRRLGHLPVAELTTHSSSLIQARFHPCRPGVLAIASKDENNVSVWDLAADPELTSRFENSLLPQDVTNNAKAPTNASSGSADSAGETLVFSKKNQEERDGDSSLSSRSNMVSPSYYLGGDERDAAMSVDKTIMERVMSDDQLTTLATRTSSRTNSDQPRSTIKKSMSMLDIRGGSNLDDGNDVFKSGSPPNIGSGMSAVKLANGLTKLGLDEGKGVERIMLAYDAAKNQMSTIYLPHRTRTTFSDMTGFAWQLSDERDLSRVESDTNIEDRLLVCGLDGKMENMAIHHTTCLSVSPCNDIVFGASQEVYQTALQTDDNEDIAVAIRRRAIHGYCLKPIDNIAALAKEKGCRDLRNIWSWLHSHAKTNSMDPKGIMASLFGNQVSVKDGVQNLDFALKPKRSMNVLNLPVYSTSERENMIEMCGWPRGALDMEALKKIEPRERAVAMAVLNGEIDKAVALLRLIGDIPVSVRIALSGFPFARTEKSALWEEMARDLIGNELTPDFPYLQLAFGLLLAGGGDKTAEDLGDIWNEFSGLEPSSSGAGGGAGRRYLRGGRQAMYGAHNEAGGVSRELRRADMTISIADRTALACRFLPNAQLYAYLERLCQSAEQSGQIEGFLLFGYTNRGMKLLESYVNQTGDVQSAALLTSYGAFSSHDTISTESFVAAYRDLLNRWGLFKERARYDCDRAAIERQKFKSTIVPWVPKATLSARCGSCGASFVIETLIAQGTANQSWLSREKPVIPACPACKRGLPRCSICLLPLGTINPYVLQAMEKADKEGGTGRVQDPSDWMSWCVTCGHGGHSKCLALWSKKNKSHEKRCPVNGCDCECGQ